MAETLEGGGGGAISVGTGERGDAVVLPLVRR